MRVIVFDTETIGKVTQDLLNVGYQIVDINIQQATAKVLVKRDYLVSNLISNQIYCINDDFVGNDKYAMYLNLLSQKAIIKHTINKIFDLMKKDLEKYQVIFGYAFNCNFDTDKFEKTAEKMNIENPLKDLPIFDIWGYACTYICDTKEYQEWAKENDILTATGYYISTSVESICKYLYNNLEFKENHTALSDTEHETNILLECIKQGCDITRPLTKHNIKSDKVFTKVLVLPNGEEKVIEYTKEYTRGDKTTYR